MVCFIYIHIIYNFITPKMIVIQDHGEEKARILSSSQSPDTFYLIQPIFIKQLLQTKAHLSTERAKV